MNYLSIIFSALIILSSCKKEPTAKEIIQRAIEAHGGDKVYNSQFSFDFRDKHYEADYKNGNYLLTRQFTDSVGNSIKDALSNKLFGRTINDTLTVISKEWEIKYANSVNSVFYFFRIPFNLIDPAVILTYLGKTSIDNTEYYKVKITFSKTDGGEDFSDQFVYWFNSQTYILEYFAYEYATSGGGKRFRKAINQRMVNGWLVSDYINYEPFNLEIDIEQYDSYFEEEGFKKLSEIINTNVEVTYQ